MPASQRFGKESFDCLGCTEDTEVNTKNGIEKQGFVLPAQVLTRERFCGAPFMVPFPMGQKKSTCLIFKRQVELVRAVG
jgi:hypothetical protein